MKGEHPPPRPKKPPSPHCMKLLISYGGFFGEPRLPAAGNGKPRYAGGETRIISVDRRGLNLPKLLARISEVLPGVLLPLPADPPSLCLCHQLLWAPDRGEGGGQAPPLVPVLGDEDVARMLKARDRLAAQGKAARLRVFLCDKEPSSAVGSSDLDASAVISGDPRVRGGVSPRRSALLEMGTAQNRAYDARDFGEALARGFQRKAVYVPGTRCFGHPSNPNVLQSSAPGTPDCGIFQKPIAKKDFVTCGVELDRPVVGDSPFLGQLLKNPETSIASGTKNRENVVPWTVGCCGAEASAAAVPVHNRMHMGASALKNVHGGISCNTLSRSRLSYVTGSDARHYRGPYDAPAHRSGLHDLGIKRTNVSDGRVCFGKCHPGLRPRSNIGKPGLARLLTYQGKLLDAGNGKGVLKERVLQPSVDRKIASQFHVQDVLPSIELGRNLFHGRADGSLPYLPPELSRHAALRVLHEAVKKDPPCFPNLEQCVAQAQILCNSNHSTHPLEYPLTCVTGPNHPMRRINELNCLERESHFMQVETGGNVEASSSKLYSSSNVRIDETKCANMDAIYPQPDPTTRLRPIHEAAKVAINGDLSANNSPLEISVRNLSVSSSTKACLPVQCSLGGSGGGGGDVLDPATSGVTESFLAREVGSCLNQVVVMEDDTLGMQSVNGKLAGETDCRPSYGQSCISVDDVVESRLLQKIPKPSSPLTTQASLAIGNDAMHCYKAQSVSSASNSKVNTEENILISSEALAGETNTKLPLVYAQLATQGLQTIKDTDLEEIRELGSGAYGTVFYGKWRGSDVAIKRLKPNCFSGGGSAKERLIADFWKEAHLLGQLHHPNVVAFYGVVTDGQGTNLATVTEYMVNGSLKQVLRRKDRTIDRRKRHIIAMDAAFGMEYLHEKSVVHFDLKSHNFLVNMRDPQRPVCKIGDLGLSKVKRRTLISGGVRGTIPWMAPELLTSQSSMVTEKVDVYSFGIVMWELLTGEEPYGDMPSDKVIAGIIKGNLRPEIPSWCDPIWRSLMERCWASDPCLRPAFSEIAKELRAIAASMNIL